VKSEFINCGNYIFLCFLVVCDLLNNNELIGDTTNHMKQHCRPGHTKFLFSGQKKIEISGHFPGHQNDVFTLK